MRIKKAIASCLVVTLMLLFVHPMTATAEFTTEKTSLYDFLSSTDDVQASYKYPSFQLSYCRNNKNGLYRIRCVCNSVK